jgi:regulator of nucleoside diphosphate kinase
MTLFLSLALFQTSGSKESAMARNPPIVITESDFGLLRRLAGHPRLAAELKKAVVIDSRCIASDIVTMNSRVRYVDQHTSEVREVTIVFPNEANPSTASISVLTPVGTALLGLAVGQSIDWPFADGTQHCLRVLKVVYQPEADDAPNERAQRTGNAASEVRSA